MLTFYFILQFPHDVLKWWCLFLFSILYIWRIVYYCKIKCFLFCIDFCYVANLAVYLYLCAFPKSDVFFKMAFVLGSGIAGTASPILRNNYSPHDLDALFSLYIHVMPMVLMFVNKWVTLTNDG